MNFMDPQKTYALVLGIFFIVCFGGAIMAIMVTNETRSESGGSGLWYIVGAILLAIVGWMVIDYIWFPQYADMPLKEYVKFWIHSKIH